MKHLLTAGAFFFLLGLMVTCEALSNEKQQMIDRVVHQIMRCNKIPSLSLSLLSLEDGSAYNHGYNYNTSTSSGQPQASANSVFCIGGATQAFTAVLLAKLIDENENVTWDTPVQELLGRRVAMPDLYRSDNLNLRDILGMRTGLDGLDIVTVAKPFRRAKLVRRLQYSPEVSGFRDGYVHNEVMFAFIEDVVQVLGGDTWQNLLRLHILQPLQMRDTVFVGQTGTAQVMNPVVSTNGYPYPLDIASLSGKELVAPAAGMCTSANDMGKWLRFLLTEGLDSKNDRLIRKNALEYTYQAVQSRGNGMDPIVQGYRHPDIQVPYSREQNALGWIKGHYRGYPFISQDGSLPGLQTLVTVIPSRNVGVYVAFAGDEDPKGFAAKTLVNTVVLDALMQGRPWFSDSDVCKNIEELEGQHPREQKPIYSRAATYQGPRELDAYTGVYRNFAFGDLAIRLNESESDRLTMDYGMASYKLEPTYTNDTFQAVALAGPMWYMTNADRYRGKLFITFLADPRDKENRISEATVLGFDRYVDPVFSTNAHPPAVESRDSECSGCSHLLSWWCTLLIIAVLFRR